MKLELVNEHVEGERIDFAWPSAKVVVEVDEHATHGTRARFEDGYRRNMKRQAAGWEPLRYTTDQVDFEGDAVVSAIRRSIGERRR